MKKFITSAALFSSLAIAASGVSANAIKNGVLTGNIVTKSVYIPATSTAALYTTPASGFFTITQMCGSVSGMTLWTIDPIFQAGSSECVTFEPGLAMPANQVISCQNPQAFAAPCMITGVLTSK